MKAEIITIGDEILIGQIVDTNSAWIASQLNATGIKVGNITSISDNADEIKQALQQAEKDHNLIIITGGLGPTTDDITKKVLGDYFECTKMVLHQPTLDFIVERFSKRGIEINDLNQQQAEVPECCTVIQNMNGTAPGMWFEKKDKIFVSLPGVPFEMKELLPTVIEKIKHKVGLPNIYKTVLTYGIPESELAKKIEAWEKALPKEISLAYLPNIETGVRLRLSQETQLNDTLIDKSIEELKSVLGNHIYGFEPDNLESVVGRLLLQQNKTLSTAESCTGGRIGHKITSVPGSSAYYKGGIIAYSNEAKINLLGVNPNDINKFGAVSSQVALQMAEGACRVLKTDYAISTTGVAGPGGGTIENPIGLCWFGLVTPNGSQTFSQTFISGRVGNIATATSVALNALRLAANEN